MIRAKSPEEATQKAQEFGIISQKAQATKEIIAGNQAAAAGAAAPAGQEAELPTGNPADVVAPVATTVNVMDLYRQRQAKQYEEEKAREQERINRSRLGTGIAGLAATIGDMVRASEGAPVQPRDWQRIYDNLTAQERANINNYQVRMAKLHEDARADRMAAAQTAAKAQAAQQQREFEAMKFRIERDDKLSEADKKRLLDWWIANLNAEAKENAASIRARHSGSGGDKRKPVRFSYFGKSIDVYDGQSFTNMMNDILSVLNNPMNTDTANGHKFKRVAFKPKEIQDDPQGFYNRRIKDLLAPAYQNTYTQTARTMIENIIKNYEYGSEAGGDFSEVEEEKDGLPGGVDLLAGAQG